MSDILNSLTNDGHFDVAWDLAEQTGVCLPVDMSIRQLMDFIHGRHKLSYCAAAVHIRGQIDCFWSKQIKPGYDYRRAFYPSDYSHTRFVTPKP